MYNLTRKRLQKLREVDSIQYDNLLDSTYVRNKIADFKDLSKQAWYKTEYKEVAQAVSQEQEVWSSSSSSPNVLSPVERVKSPIQESIQQVISPKEEDSVSPEMMNYAIDEPQIVKESSSTFTSILEEVRPPKNTTTVEAVSSKSDISSDPNLLEKARTSFLDIIKKRRNESDVIDSAKRYEAEDTPNITVTEDVQTTSNIVPEQPIAGPSRLSPIIKDVEHLDDSDLMKAVEETFSEDINLRLESTDSKVKLPDIKVDSSSDESMEHYFPKPEITQEEVKSGFNTLFEHIKANKIESPNITNIGLQPELVSQSAQSSSKLLSPLHNIHSKFDDTAALFDDDDLDLPGIPIDKGKNIEISNLDEKAKALYFKLFEILLIKLHFF